MNLGFAAEFCGNGENAEAVRLYAAVATAFADGLVNEDTLRGRFGLASFAFAP